MKFNLIEDKYELLRNLWFVSQENPNVENYNNIIRIKAHK